MLAIKWDGKIITRPGLYAGVPLDVYHGQKICDGPSVSSSGLRRALEVNGGSPAHFYDEWTGNPKAREPEDKKHFILGRAAHHLYLGQADFSKLFIVRPDELPHYKTGEMRGWHGNHIECKDWLERIAVTGKTVLTPEDIESIQGMAVSLANNSYVRGVKGKDDKMHGILSGEVERSMFWRDQETGIWLKSRPDAIPTDSGDFGDLKTTISVARHKLNHTITECAYHQQGALVREGAKICIDIEMTMFALVFVEKKSPYCVRVIVLDDADIVTGHKQNHEAIRLISRCIKDKRWPGPGDAEISKIALTERYRTTVAQRLAQGASQ